MNQSSNTHLKTGVIALKSADKLPRSIVFDGGFKLIGTPLAFKGSRNPGLLFFSDLNMRVPSGTRRVLGSEVVIGSLGKRKNKIDAIAVTCDRLFKLGKMDLRLLPSGMGPGATLLEITYNQKRIIYASGLRTALPLSSDPIPPVKCDILLLDFEAPQTRGPAPRTTKSELVKWGQRQSCGLAPVILSDQSSGIFEAVAAFSDESMLRFAHRATYTMLRNAAIAQGQQLKLKRLGRQWPDKGVVFADTAAFSKSEFFDNPDIPKAYCGPALSEGDSAFDTAFRLGEPEHIAGLVQFAKSAGAHTVAISPAAGEQCAAAFQKGGFDVHFSRIPKQLKLPL